MNPQYLLFTIGIFTIGLPFVFEAEWLAGRGYYLVSFVLALINIAAIYLIRKHFYLKKQVLEFALHHSKYSKEQMLEISQEGIVFHVTGLQYIVKWSDFMDIKEYDSVFYTTEKSGIISYISK